MAFVVVAVVFSYVVLGAGFFTTQKAQETVYSSVDMASSSLEVLGDV
nr:flagellin [Methanolacinia petrolearia]